MIVYEFVFTDEDGNEIRQDVWADFEKEAWRKAESIAFQNGYVDYRMVED